jgi:hypothetical protein
LNFQLLEVIRDCGYLSAYCSNYGLLGRCGLLGLCVRVFRVIGKAIISGVFNVCVVMLCVPWGV